MRRVIWLSGVLAMLGGCGAGESDGELVGTWVGSAGGFEITAVVADEYAGSSGLYGGRVETSNKSCLTNGMVLGRLTRSSVELNASGAGFESQTTILRITGELDGGKIGGLVSMTGDTGAPCDLEKSPLVLERR